MNWWALEDDNIGRWVVHWKDAGRVVRSDELDDSVENIFEVGKEVDREVDSVGRNGI